MPGQPAVGGAQVTDVRVESGRPAGLSGAGQANYRLGHKFRGPAGMPAAGGIQLAALFQSFEPVVAQRFQQPVAGRTAVAVGGDQ